MRKLLNFIQRQKKHLIKICFDCVLKILKLCLIAFIIFLILGAILISFQWISQFTTYDVSTLPAKEKVGLLGLRG